jgi:phage terminase large subunit GpA-like protein
MPALAEVRRRALASLIPPERVPLSQWIESNVRLPQGLAATPGPVRLWPHQRGIADAIGDPAIERVTVLKSARVGFTSLLSAAIGHHCVNDPAPVLCLQPTESDVRDFTVSDLEPLFEASPALRGALSRDVARNEDRSTLAHRIFPGGSLKIIASRSPRNLRRHSARILFCDECDAYETSAEGSPLALAERRTLTFGDRKIVLGSTPLFEETSAICRAYAASDGRVFEIPCAACGTFAEIAWRMIEWPSGEPERAAFRCPSCGELVGEEHKASMVERGQWRALRPEVRGHAGFRVNALVSLLPNASWGKLASEFVAAKDSPDTLRVFVNTLLAEPWRSDAESDLNEGELQARAEPFSLDAIPPEVLIVTAGVDVQVDRLEASFVGFTRGSESLVLAHETLWGAPDQDEPWRALEELLRARWRHPLGGSIGVDAAVIDSGFATDSVYRFAFPRAGRRVMAGKGMPGARPIIAASKTRIATKTGLAGRLWIVGVDGIKTTLFAKLARGRSIRFSDSLEPSWFEQLASERVVVRYSRGQPVRMFERIPGKRAEALDAMVYATAARASLGTVNFDQREAALRHPESAPPPVARRPAVIRSAWLDRQLPFVAWPRGPDFMDGPPRSNLISK